jgi:4-aminobutyrate aminotransferase-like enzyme
VGRYDEPRLLYVADAFRIGPRITDERGTLHIGLDLFAPAGTRVFAPIAGVVHAVDDNAATQDYGPVVVLRHTTDDGDVFFTLYGHLSRESIAALSVGRSVAVGQAVATLGTADVNGGWTPHLHFQVITDLLELGTDFPGVGRVSQRAVWRSLSPDPNLILAIPLKRFPAPAPTSDETVARRADHVGRNLSIAYRRPVKIVRGWQQYLFDDGGRRFIDAYNNVPHVGHCHPRVVEAAAAQMRVLNTNTRYLNDLLAEYASRLLDTLPAPLSVCYFVNSASEANELALRLARAHTGRRDTIVLDAAYHGNTTSLVDISPYKHNGPGGHGPPDWVHVAPIPDDYRGPYKRGDPDAGPRYARAVAEIVASLTHRGRAPAAFIAETCPSVGGQIVFPPGYLRDVYRAVRAAGGVCIADEVQTGLGRMGTHFWAFEAQQVVPDIVVMGKPLGNGHPIGAVATTRAIADAFDNGMEFFSTFGGNTVSCAIGLAVLDVLRDEDLQSHARIVGEYLLARLRPLVDEHPRVGDIRGSGFFLGVELVRDRTTLEPAGAEASFVADVMRDDGILLGTDGPYHNVVKIRPPMPFGDGDADVLVDALNRALSRIRVRR